MEALGSLAPTYWMTLFTNFDLDNSFSFNMWPQFTDTGHEGAKTALQIGR